MAPGAFDLFGLSLGSSGLLGAVSAGLLSAALPFAIGRNLGAPRAGLLAALCCFLVGLAGGILVAAPVVALASYLVGRWAREPLVEFELVGAADGKARKSA